jgi:hypothetical protein
MLIDLLSVLPSQFGQTPALWYIRTIPARGVVSDAHGWLSCVTLCVWILGISFLGTHRARHPPNSTLSACFDRTSIFDPKLELVFGRN